MYALNMCESIINLRLLPDLCAVDVQQQRDGNHQSSQTAEESACPFDA